MVLRRPFWHRRPELCHWAWRNGRVDGHGTLESVAGCGELERGLLHELGRIPVVRGSFGSWGIEFSIDRSEVDPKQLTAVLSRELSMSFWKMKSARSE